MLRFNDMSTLVGHFVLSPEKGRKEIEEIVEEMKEKDRKNKSARVLLHRTLVTQAFNFYLVT